jgi:predicted nucleic acid-binding protein
MVACPRYYWDTSCFISLLSSDTEWQRHSICIDVLDHARAGDIEIWTSCWTIVETVRPRNRYIPEPLPSWSKAFKVSRKGVPVYPTAEAEVQAIWDFYKRNTMPSRLLSEHQAEKIKQMFAWPWIKKVQVVPTIAAHAAEIARTCNLKPADALHVASALARKCDYLHRWDKHFQKTDHLIQSKEPIRLSPPDLLTEIPPPPDNNHS